MLSPTLDTIITIEHQGSIDLVELRTKYGHGFKGIVGKLDAQGLIKKNHSRERECYYTLTQEGQRFIDQTLGSLHRTDKPWHGQWLAITMRIPERNRSDRDKLRRLLKRNGFGCLYGSLWIRPAGSNIEIAEIKKLARRGQITVIEGRADDDPQIAQSAWDLEELRKKYETYITQTTKKLSTLPDTPQKLKMEIKKIIFELATITVQEPALPSDLLPADWPKGRAFTLYQKVRRKLF